MSSVETVFSKNTKQMTRYRHHFYHFADYDTVFACGWMRRRRRWWFRLNLHSWKKQTRRRRQKWEWEKKAMAFSRVYVLKIHYYLAQIYWIWNELVCTVWTIKTKNDLMQIVKSDKRDMYIEQFAQKKGDSECVYRMNTSDGRSQVFGGGGMKKLKWILS